MGVFDKIMNSMRIDSDPSDDDYYDDADEYYDDPPKKGGLFSRKTKNDYYDDYDADDRTVISASRVRSASSSRRSMEIQGIKPTQRSEGMDIVDSLLRGKVVFINMKGTDTQVAQRILDFVSGATYGMHGKVQQFDEYIFVASPEPVDITGEFKDLFDAESMDASGFNLHL